MSCPKFRHLFLCVLLSMLVWTHIGYTKIMPAEFDAGRNRLIGYILGRQLTAQHFSHKNMDDTLSRAAFDLYLKQLDPGKRFLLKEDVHQLQAFAEHIDDELQRGHIVLPDAGLALLGDRIKQIRLICDEILSSEFDVKPEIFLEIDPKKREYLASTTELRLRWYRILQMQSLTEYLILLKEKDKAQDKKGFFERLLAKMEAPGDKSTFMDIEVWKKAKEKIKKRNDAFLERLLQETRQDHYNRYFNAISRAFDPHTTYMPPTSKEDFDIHMRGTLEGIGALLREEDGYIKVVRIIPGSAAEKQGQLQAEDIILAVGEKDGEPVDISHMRIREAVGYIRGPKGTEVRLTVRRSDGGKQLVVPIIRDVVQIEDTYVKSTIIDYGTNNHLGYIKIPSFYRDFAAARNGDGGRNVSDDVRQVLIDFKDKNLSGVIVDLRNNGGGSLSDAVEVSGLFIADGPIVQVKNSQGMIRVLQDDDTDVRYAGPLIVIVNKFSASASEIMAAALQDYGRALIIGGKNTHGKGTVQAILDLNRNMPFLHLKKYQDLGALKITIQKFYRISGDSTQSKGVEPDIYLPDAFEYLKSGEKHLDYALPWDQVHSVNYTKVKKQSFSIEKARTIVNADLETNKKFTDLMQQRDLALKRSKETRLDISLSGLLKRRQEAENEFPDPQHEKETSKSKEKKNEVEKLKEELSNDPYIQESIHLFAVTYDKSQR